MTIAELRKLAEARTKGEWEYANVNSVGSGRVCNIDPTEPGGGQSICSISWDAWRPSSNIRRYMGADEGDRNGDFIAATANHIDALLDVVEAAKAAISWLPNMEPIPGTPRDSQYNRESWALRQSLTKLESI